MTADTLAQARREAAAVASRVRLPMRSRIWKGQAGEFAGAGSGASLDFQDHREYQPGDDPRHINWQAYARTGHHTMKLFREEVRPIIELVVDVSRSMSYHPAKARVTASLALLIVQSASATGAGIRVHTLCGNTVETVDADAARGHTWIAEAMTSAGNAEPPDPGRIELRANTVRVFLSDLLYPGDPEKIIRHLGGRGSMLVMLAPFLAEEAAPGWDGNCEFVDVERSTHHPGKIGADLVKRYRNAYANHFQLWHTTASRHRAPLARIPAGMEFATAVFQHAVPTGALEMV